jgi:hypothetical protein
MNVSPGVISARNTGLVHLAAAVGLDVGELAAEQLLGALNREGLDLVGVLAAAVVAAAR